MARLPRWEPENEQFWRETGSGIAWRTCGITTFSLIFSFATWFVMSAVVVRLPNIGFKFNTMELFWLAAIPGFGSGTLRLIHSYFIPVLGTRPVVSIATIIKLLPMVWLGYAVQDLSTSWGTFMIIGYLSGFGGGDFSSYMPSTSIFFPKRLQGISMGIQAGFGNFGVSVVQFVTPWIIGFAALGAVVGGPQIFTKGEVIKGAITVTKDAGGAVTDIVVNKPELAAALVITKEGGVVKDVVVQDTDTVKAIKADVVKDASGVITAVNKTEGILVGGTAPFTPVKKNAAGAVTDVAVKKVVKKAIWVQNAAFWYVPFLILAFILCVIFLRSVTVPARGFKGQFEILSTRNRALTHTWNCTITYITTFGSFSGYAAAFPMMSAGPVGIRVPRASRRRAHPRYHRPSMGQVGRKRRHVLPDSRADTRLSYPYIRRVPYDDEPVAVPGVPLDNALHVLDDGHGQRGDIPSVPDSLRVFAGQGGADARLDGRVGGVRPVCLQLPYRHVHNQDRQRDSLLRWRGNLLYVCQLPELVVLLPQGMRARGLRQLRRHMVGEAFRRREGQDEAHRPAPIAFFLL
ncbi:MAG: hypothetical protein HZB21_00545 [Deltaproteobacteria bacterium]|nr:hypothetical protein [Deltaproteobacteria bacterium]